MSLFVVLTKKWHSKAVRHPTEIGRPTALLCFFCNYSRFILLPSLCARFLNNRTMILFIRANVWRCVNRLEFGRKNCKDSPSLKEPALQRAILNCIQSTVTDRQEIANLVRETEKNILIAESSGEDPTAMFERIRQIDQEMSSLLELVVNSDTPEIYDGKFKSLSDEKAALQKKLDSMTKQAEADSRSRKRLEKLLGEITESEVQLTDYNDEFIRRVVEQVTVLSATQIEVRFVGGYSKIGSIE